MWYPARRKWWITILKPLPPAISSGIFWNHSTLEKACFDIDGVCWPPEQNDDRKPKYRDFILNVALLFIPGSRIGTIVTSRLENTGRKPKPG